MMKHRFSTPLAIALAGAIGCGGGTTPFSPLPVSPETPTSPPAPTLPPLPVVPGLKLVWVTPASGSTVLVSRCQFPADTYESPVAMATGANLAVRPLHEVGDCSTVGSVNLQVQVAESALSRVLVQFVDGAFADGGITCAGASWTGMLNAGSPRQFVFTNFEVGCSRPRTTNRLLITLSQCPANQPYGPCPAVLVREEIPHAYQFGES